MILIRASNKMPLFFFSLLASFTISLRTVDNITVTIKRRPNVSPRCQIRVKSVSGSELKIKSGENVTFTFTCSTPEKYFIMEIQKNIGKIQVFNFSPNCNFSSVKPHTFFFLVLY